jgi:hypothetical protein
MNTLNKELKKEQKNNESVSRSAALQAEDWFGVGSGNS